MGVAIAPPVAQIANFNIPPHSGDGQLFFALMCAQVRRLKPVSPLNDIPGRPITLANMRIKSNLILHVSRIALFGMLAAAFILFILFNITSFSQNDFMYGAAAAVWANMEIFIRMFLLYRPRSL